MRLSLSVRNKLISDWNSRSRARPQTTPLTAGRTVTLVAHRLPVRTDTQTIAEFVDLMPDAFGRTHLVAPLAAARLARS